MREAASLCVNNMNLSITDMKGGLFVLLIENNNLRRSLNSKPLPHLTFRPMPMFAGLQRRQTMDCSFFNNECNLMWPTLNIYIYIANSRYVYICIYIRIQHTNTYIFSISTFTFCTPICLISILFTFETRFSNSL